jgi:hypothetical protein
VVGRQRLATQPVGQQHPVLQQVVESEAAAVAVQAAAVDPAGIRVGPDQLDQQVV